MAATPSPSLSKPCDDRKEDVAGEEIIGDQSLGSGRIVAGMYNCDVRAREKNMVATFRVGLPMWET